MRNTVKFPTNKKEEFKLRLLAWASEKECFCFFYEGNRENQTENYEGFKIIAGIGLISELQSVLEKDFVMLENYIKTERDTLIGFLSYDLKNQTEKLYSENPDGIEMPLIHFFQPELLFIFPEINNEIEVGYLPAMQNKEEVISLCNMIDNISLENKFEKSKEVFPVCRVSKDEHLENVRKIKAYIQFGDVYELNYCIEFFAENVEINPVEVYKKLNKISPAPFSCFYKVGNKYLICASPERFLKKEGKKIIAQPMKGTAKRSNNVEEDRHLKEQLFTNEKERAENVMIVDLVRNDLSKTATPKSVKVDELFGVYSFPQVHQMVSTISSEMRSDTGIVDVIKSTFPMGSMTGAPKVKAMELIEKFETSKRGLFSGAVGYITPEKDFDFNVVIRSIQYNADKKYLSFMVGSAITINSDPEKEYEECLLKAQALIEALK